MAATLSAVCDSLMTLSHLHNLCMFRVRSRAGSKLVGEKKNRSVATRTGECSFDRLRSTFTVDEKMLGELGGLVLALPASLVANATG